MYVSLSSIDVNALLILHFVSSFETHLADKKRHIFIKVPSPPGDDLLIRIYLTRLAPLSEMPAVLHSFRFNSQNNRGHQTKQVKAKP